MIPHPIRQITFCLLKLRNRSRCLQTFTYVPRFKNAVRFAPFYGNWKFGKYSRYIRWFMSHTHDRYVSQFSNKLLIKCIY